LLKLAATLADTQFTFHIDTGHVHSAS